MNVHLRACVERLHAAAPAPVDDQLADFERHFPPGALPPGPRDAIRSLIARGLTTFTAPDRFQLHPQARLLLASRIAEENANG